MKGASSVPEKLTILADAAKYDASCSSSGGAKRNARESGGIGSVTGNGICHSYTPDGRCVSLLKILLTNFCIFDCAYCINRKSSNVQRARFSVEEVVDLTLNFYRRNYIEGLFLSSGIIRSSDYTMECLVRVARTLREDHAFRGYIHLKTIPDASPELIHQAGLYADRLSINIELPTAQSLQQFAPEKELRSIHQTMGNLGERIAEAKENLRSTRRAPPPKFAPAGQSTQLIVGADDSSDAVILNSATTLYSKYRLKRIYYSAFSPIPDSSVILPSKAAPLIRENRLYQADWLVRFYGFTPDEIVSSTTDGMLDQETDPKLSWALQNRDRFPVDVNIAERATLLRIPGLGTRSVDKLITARRQSRITLADLKRIAGSVTRMRPFVVTADYRPTRLLDSQALRSTMLQQTRQLALF